MALQWINHWSKAHSPNDIQGQWAQQLYSYAIKSNNPLPAEPPIEQWRRQLRANHSPIHIEDFGAGSRAEKKHSHSKDPANNTGITRLVSQIARNSATPKRFCRIWSQLIAYTQAHYILELGTSLGVCTAYLASTSPKVKVYTLEGSQSVATLAQQGWQQLGLSQQINCQTGNINHTLAPTLEQLPQLDLVLFDANHRLAPTLAYFEQCLPLAHAESLFIFDDIHWSREMELAWSRIKAHPAVTLSIDLFRAGIVAFTPSIQKQHYTLRY